MHELWIAMAGPAGVGKSTLTDMVAATMRGDGTPAVTFGEEELFTRPEFVQVADGFRSHNAAAPECFESAYAAWLSNLPDRAIAVMDWNPAGMTGDLPWGLAGQGCFLTHLRTVRALAGERVLLLHLQAPADLATRRAAQERGSEWLTRYDRLAQAAGHAESDQLARIAALTEAHITRTDAELETAAAAGWPIHAVDATGSRSEVRDRAMSVIDNYRRRPQQ